MVIYGTALLSICYILGMLLGDFLGLLLGVDSNVGGVGIGMLLLIVASDQIKRRGLLDEKSDLGVAFWSMIYIPVVVAMSAGQNVIAAVNSGWLAAACGVVAVTLGFILVPILTGASGETIGSSPTGAGVDE